MKKTLIQQLDDLRDLLNNTTVYKQTVFDKKDEGSWNRLWSSLDNLEDSQKVIELFKSKKEIDLLDRYGILQAIYVQQDALSDLAYALELKGISYKNHKRLQEIRDIRDETIGHPTYREIVKKGEYRDGKISFTSMYVKNKEKILTYMVYTSTGNINKSIDLAKVVDDQEQLLGKELEQVVKQIKTRESKHKKKFIGKKISDTLPSFNYELQKMYPFERVREISKMNFSIIKEAVYKFEEEYKERYGKNSLTKDYIRNPGLVESIFKIHQMFDRIDEMIELKEGVLELDLEVYVESLGRELQGLKDMAKEIDEEFNLEETK